MNTMRVMNVTTVSNYCEAINSLPWLLMIVSCKHRQMTFAPSEGGGGKKKNHPCRTVFLGRYLHFRHY